MLCLLEPQEQNAPLNITVAAIPNEKSWGLTDLLGRDMGRITETNPGVFMIRPAGNAVDTLAAIISRP